MRRVRQHFAVKRSSTDVRVLADPEQVRRRLPPLCGSSRLFPCAAYVLAGRVRVLHSVPPSEGFRHASSVHHRDDGSAVDSRSPGRRALARCAHRPISGVREPHGDCVTTLLTVRILILNGQEIYFVHQPLPGLVGYPSCRGDIKKDERKAQDSISFCTELRHRQEYCRREPAILGSRKYLISADNVPYVSFWCRG